MSLFNQPGSTQYNKNILTDIEFHQPPCLTRPIAFFPQYEETPIANIALIKA